MKLFVVIFILMAPVLAFSQTRSMERYQRRLEKKYIRMERQRLNEWNVYEMDMPSLYDSWPLSEYYIDWTISPSYSDYLLKDYPGLRERGTIINLFDYENGMFKYSESIYIENLDQQFVIPEYVAPVLPSFDIY